MERRTRCSGITSACAVFLLVLIGCSPASNEPIRAATVRTALPAPPATAPAPTTPPTTPPVPAAPDPSIIPSDPAAIDEDYLNAVLAGLNQVDGDIVRILVRERAFTPELEQKLRAIYHPAFIDAQFARLGRQAAEGLDGFLDPPGDRMSTVKHILHASPSCVFVHVKHDFSQVVATPPPEVGEDFFVLRPAQSSSDENPTAWVIDDEIVVIDGATPRNSCDR